VRTHSYGSGNDSDLSGDAANAVGGPATVAIEVAMLRGQAVYRLGERRMCRQLSTRSSRRFE
jgi:hypothetical protein